MHRGLSVPARAAALLAALLAVTPGCRPANHVCGSEFGCVCDCRVCARRGSDGTCAHEEVRREAASWCSPQDADKPSECEAVARAALESMGEQCTRICGQTLRDVQGLDVLGCDIAPPSAQPLQVVETDDRICAQLDVMERKD